MGYYTYFKDIIIKVPSAMFKSLDHDYEKIHDIVKNTFHEVAGYDFDYGTFDFQEDMFLIEVALDEQCKWYGWKEDLKKISTIFPNSTISIAGEGEESGDIWEAYFRNGKGAVSNARMTFWNKDEATLRDTVLNSNVKSTSCKAVSAYEKKLKTEKQEEINQKKKKIESLKEEIDRIENG